MTQTAKFTIVVNDNQHLDLSNISPDRIVTEFEQPYFDADDLTDKYEYARENWGDCYVVVETPDFKMTSSQTYNEELLDNN